MEQKGTIDIYSFAIFTVGVIVIIFLISSLILIFQKVDQQNEFLKFTQKFCELKGGTHIGTTTQTKDYSIITCMTQTQNHTILQDYLVYEPTTKKGVCGIKEKPIKRDSQ